MAIYSRFGEVITIERYATLADVTRLDRRKPDAQDRKAVKSKSYVIVRFADGSEQLYHLAFLRADGALPEIMNAVRAAAGETETTTTT